MQVFQPQSVCFMTKGMIIRDMMNSMMSHIIVILVRGCYIRPLGGVKVVGGATQSVGVLVFLDFVIQV